MPKLPSGAIASATKYSGDTMRMSMVRRCGCGSASSCTPPTSRLSAALRTWVEDEAELHPDGVDVDAAVWRGVALDGDAVEAHEQAGDAAFGLRHQPLEVFLEHGRRLYRVRRGESSGRAAAAATSPTGADAPQASGRWRVGAADRRIVLLREARVRRHGALRQRAGRRLVEAAAAEIDREADRSADRPGRLCRMPTGRTWAITVKSPPAGIMPASDLRRRRGTTSTNIGAGAAGIEPPRRGRVEERRLPRRQRQRRAADVRQLDVGAAAAGSSCTRRR